MESTVSLQAKKEIYTGIDLMKIICAVIILYSHTAAYVYKYGMSLIATSLIYGAVNFFFIASGFLFAKSMLKKDEVGQKAYFKKYELRLIKVYAIWTLISLPLTLSIYINKYKGDNIKIFLTVFRNIFFTGSYGIYWFILSLILSIAILYIVVFKFKKEKLMYIVSFALFILGLVYTFFYPALENKPVFSIIFKGIYYLWTDNKNFALRGMFCVATGYFFAKKEIKPNLPVALAGSIFFTLLRAGEHLFKAYSTHPFFGSNTLFLSIIFQGAFFFWLAISIKSKFTHKTSLILRQISTTIFYTHMIVLGIIDPTLKKGFLFDFFVTLAICLTFYLIIKLINNKHLNILINS